MSVGEWVPPWLRFQHEERYRFAGQLARNRRVLDAACGNGYGTAMMREQGAASVAGVDLAWDAVRQASAFHATAGAGFLLGSALALPFADAAFDLFVSLETIEHIEDDRAYVDEARRVVKSDGIFLCSTPNRQVLNPGRSLTDKPFNPFHVREYTVGELDALLRRAFPTIRWFGQTPFASGYVSILTAIGRRLPMLAVRIHQMRKLLGALFERTARHTPVALPARGGAPEVLIAVCSA